VVAFELHFEITPDLLVEPMQVEYEVVVDSAFVVLALLPLAHLLDLIVLAVFDVESRDPLPVIKDRLDRVVFHVRDDDVEVHLHREGAKTD